MPHTKPHGRDLRKGRVSLENQIYLLTTTTHNRNPIFADFYTARLLINELQRCERNGDVESLCFVVMPDHLHWLVSFGPSTKLAQLMRTIKGRSSRKINQYRNTTGQFVWQKGFHDRAIRKEEDLLTVARYVVANPLRAKLVDNIAAYPHWDSVWL